MAASLELLEFAIVLAAARDDKQLARDLRRGADDELRQTRHLAVTANE
jgi:hypothetical protein